MSLAPICWPHRSACSFGVSSGRPRHHAYERSLSSKNRLILLPPPLLLRTASRSDCRRRRRRRRHAAALPAEHNSRHAPSLVVLDDLDKIAPAEGGEGAGAAYDAQAARIAERLEDLLLAEGARHYLFCFCPLSVGAAVAVDAITPSPWFMLRGMRGVARARGPG